MARKWLSQTDVARQCHKTRALIGQDLTRARQRWRKISSLTEVRREIAEFLASQGGCATADELAQFVLSVHPSAADDSMLRVRRAAAVVRAALEAERVADQPRWEESRGHGLFLVALDTPEHPATDLFQYSNNLADIARQLAETDPLPSPARVLEMLRAVQPAPAALPDNRLARAWLRPRPRSLYLLDWTDSHRHVGWAGTKAGPSRLGWPEPSSRCRYRQRIRDRYPEAESLPGRPELDELLREAGLNLDWHEADQLYVAPRPGTLESSTLLIDPQQSPRRSASTSRSRRSARAAAGS